VYDVGEGEGHNNACVNYHESELLNININAYVNDNIEST
jgi:hypothetical protein